MSKNTNKNMVDLSVGYHTMREYAISRLHGLFMEEKANSEFLTIGSEAFPALKLDANRHRYMAGIFKSVADDLAGPRGGITDSAAWRNSLCPKCERESNNA